MNEIYSSGLISINVDILYNDFLTKLILLSSITLKEIQKLSLELNISEYVNILL